MSRKPQTQSNSPFGVIVGPEIRCTRCLDAFSVLSPVLLIVRVLFTPDEANRIRTTRRPRGRGDTVAVCESEGRERCGVACREGFQGDAKLL